jgi:ubiquinone/menaquinone biosynthesis C-methylase UbiE
MRTWFLRLAFHLLYYQLAWTYDLVAWLVSFGEWAAWRRTVTLFLQEGPTLELGYGTGGLVADLTARGLSPVGLDLSPYMAHLARRRLARQGAALRLVRGRAQKLPFPDAAFANVVAAFPTDFILDPHTLASVVRVLQPEGRLVIVTMGYLRSPGTGRSPSMGRSPGYLQRFVEWLYQVTGQREIPEPRPLDRLKAAGFDAHWEDATLEGATARLLVATRESERTPHLQRGFVPGPPRGIISADWVQIP